MQYNFDLFIDRKGTNCSKWDFADQRFGGTDLLPLSIADMDFAVAPAIIKKMEERLKFPIFGYERLGDGYYEPLVSWMKRRHDYTIKKEWIVFTSGVCTILSYAVDALTPKDSEILVPTPVYHHFFSAIENVGRTVKQVPLMMDEKKRYTYDFAALEKAVTPKTAAIMLCSPHNPIGRVWDRDELEKMAEFCLKHKLLVIDDEIHHDIVFDKKHTVFCRISPEIEQNCVLCTAPSKTFNVAGLKISNAIIPNAELRNTYKKYMRSHNAADPHALSEAVMAGAYGESEQWVDEMNAYVKANIDYFCEEAEKRLPKLKVIRPEGTYMLCVDFSEWNMSAEEISHFLVHDCKLAVNQGAIFGAGGEQMARFNLACPRMVAEEALKRLESGFSAFKIL